MIKTDKLSRKYGSFTAVDNVSFEIQPGEVVGLLGHNGAGKTTILKMITGFLEPSAGAISIDNKDITEDRLSVQKKIGYLPENGPVYPDMSVVDYLLFMAELRAVPEDIKKSIVREALMRTELMDRANQTIGTLSRGYQQRVGVAQALLHNPQILILDEPTNGLDPSQIQHMRSLIADLSQKSTVIISTHVLQEVQAVCDRVIIIVNGRVALDSKITDLQKSSRVLLSIDRSPEDAQEKLSALEGVQSVSFLREEDAQFHYALQMGQGETGAPPLSQVPHIISALTNDGVTIFAIHPEKRDLETIFKEINIDAREIQNVH